MGKQNRKERQQTLSQNFPSLNVYRSKLSASGKSLNPQGLFFPKEQMNHNAAGMKSFSPFTDTYKKSKRHYMKPLSEDKSTI